MNSQIELTESVTLVRKLIDRTRERKIAWLANSTGESNGKSAFSTQLDPSQKALIVCAEDERLDFCLIEIDPRRTTRSDEDLISIMIDDPPLTPDRVVLQVSIEKDPSYGYDTQEELDLSKLLVNLYELARRSAYQIDASVGKAISYLDQLAG